MYPIYLKLKYLFLDFTVQCLNQLLSSRKKKLINMDGRGVFFTSLWLSLLLRVAIITLSILLASARVWWWWDIIVFAVHLIVLCWAHGANDTKWQKRGIVPILFVFYWIDAARACQALSWLAFYLYENRLYVLMKLPPYIWEYGYIHFVRDAEAWLSLNLAARLVMSILTIVGVAGYNKTCRKVQEKEERLALPH